jgi:hypothetical protein
MSHDMSHIRIADTSSIAMEEYTAHGLHLSYRGRKRPKPLIAERFVGGHASGVSSIPAITHAMASTFLY